MCIAFTYVSDQSDPVCPYLYIIASNRDEFLDRTALRPYCWASDPHCAGTHQNCFGGRDLQGGGTWLGLRAKLLERPVEQHKPGGVRVSPSQSKVPLRFGLITNHRERSTVDKTKAPSRGKLIPDFLCKSNAKSTRQYCQDLQADPSLSTFAGFNLLLGDRKNLFYVSNRINEMVELTPGVHGLSNGLLDDDWPKVSSGKHRFQTLVQKHLETGGRASVSGEGALVDALFALMNDETPCGDASTYPGVYSEEFECPLSAICVHPFTLSSQKYYGTRNNYVILVRRDGTISFFESEKHHSETQSMQLDVEVHKLVFDPSI